MLEKAQMQEKPKISIHALLAESDQRQKLFAQWIFSDFYPRSPCGERQAQDEYKDTVTEFLSTLSLRRATDDSGVQGYRTLISIHALLAESDLFKGDHGHMSGDISIHALLAESDTSTGTDTTTDDHFYPRSPCGERHILCVVSVQVGGFLSTLSLRRATAWGGDTVKTIQFLSTLSLRRATSPTPRSFFSSLISIHALLAESDASSMVGAQLCTDFYPRSPCGERLPN